MVCACHFIFLTCCRVHVAFLLTYYLFCSNSFDIQLEDDQVHESTFEIKLVPPKSSQVTKPETSYRPMLNEKQRGQLDNYIPFIEVITLQLRTAAAEHLY